MNYIQNTIKKICINKNIEFNLVSKDWIMILKKQDKIRYIVGYKFDLNNHGVGLVCDDKYAFYDTLKTFHIPVAQHFIVFKNYDKKKILEYAEKYACDVVIKSNTGTCGNDMYHITDKNKLFSVIDKLLNKYYSISILPYYKIKNEYRTIILNNEAKLFYGKKKPIVISDGKKTIYELLCEFNKVYFKNISDKAKLNKILKDNEIYEYNWQFNLSKGAMPFFVDDNNLKNNIQNLALRVANILNLKFASVDIIELENGEFLVLEANSGVMMENFAKIVKDGEKIALSIYESAIDEMFK